MLLNLISVELGTDERLQALVNDVNPMEMSRESTLTRVHSDGIL
jgi:hypothetical protein